MSRNVKAKKHKPGCLQYSFLYVSAYLPSLNEKLLGFVKLDS